MTLFAQKHRAVRLRSPLGDDVLLFRRLTATETVSRPFNFELEALSENADVRGEDLLGEKVCVVFDLPETAGGTRCFNGYVSGFSFAGTLELERLAVYKMRLSPWLWFLTRHSDCRIFQNKTAPEIIKQVFQDRGFSAHIDQLTATYRRRDYCVQYRESDFNFVSRLMEEEGMFYFFQHSDDSHDLILADVDTGPEPIRGYARVPYYPPEQRRERDHISEWSWTQEIESGQYTLSDYNFETPRANMLGTLSKPAPHALSKFELYDYPGCHATGDEGSAISRIRLEEVQAEGKRVRGGGNVAGLTVGHPFTLTGHPRTDQNAKYFVLETSNSLASNAYESGGSGETSFWCSFVAMPDGVPYRPPRRAMKPFVQGPQTAMVTGPAGEEIYTDKYGRVKVQFHWDREGKRDQNSSCWIRVGTPWAGKTWGAISIPRIGQEVIVDFLEGDPDQPIIVGSVYNAVTMPPYGLPGAAVISGIKSDSTKCGGGYNEYVMDDTKGNELIREHGQFDKDSTIEHDLREHVLNSRFRDVTVDETIGIGNNQTITVGSNLTETVMINYAQTVGAAMELTIGAVMTHTVGADLIQAVGANKSVTVGKNLQESVSGEHSEAVTKAYSLQAKTVTVTADDEITIKTGSASINMKKSGDITIEGKKITIKGSGDVVIKGTKILQN